MWPRRFRRSRTGRCGEPGGELFGRLPTGRRRCGKPGVNCSGPSRQGGGAVRVSPPRRVEERPPARERDRPGRASGKGIDQAAHEYAGGRTIWPRDRSPTLQRPCMNRPGALAHAGQRSGTAPACPHPSACRLTDHAETRAKDMIRLLPLPPSPGSRSRPASAGDFSGAPRRTNITNIYRRSYYARTAERSRRPHVTAARRRLR